MMTQARPASSAMNPNGMKDGCGVADMTGTRTVAGFAIRNSRIRIAHIARNTFFMRMNAFSAIRR